MPQRTMMPCASSYWPAFQFLTPIFSSVFMLSPRNDLQGVTIPTKIKKKKAQLLKYRLPTFITHMTRNTEKECHEDFWSHYSKWRTIQSIQCLTKLAHCPLFCSSFSYLKGNFQKNKYSDELKDDRSTQSLVYLKNNQDPTLWSFISTQSILQTTSSLSDAISLRFKQLWNGLSVLS